MALQARLAGWKLAAALLALVVALSLTAARARATAQPNLDAALGHLEQAKAALERAARDKAGNRDKALELTGAAIAAVRDGIAAGNR
jgi:hypothetical protein